jgi:hypothetical protein
MRLPRSRLPTTTTRARSESVVSTSPGRPPCEQVVDRNVGVLLAPGSDGTDQVVLRVERCEVGTGCQYRAVPGGGLFESQAEGDSRRVRAVDADDNRAGGPIVAPTDDSHRAGASVASCRATEPSGRPS